MDQIWLDIAGEAITVVAGLAFFALSTVGAFYIKKLMVYLQEKEQVEMVAQLVHWVEQAPAFKEWTGEEKFAMVMNTAYQWLEDRGLTVDQDEVAAMIEEAVLLMKEAAAPILSD
mgnify:CR=1 FL=1